MDQRNIELNRMRDVALKLEVNQYARQEALITKAELRAILDTDVTAFKNDIKNQRKSIWAWAGTVIAVLIGGDVWAMWSFAERMEAALQAEVEKNRSEVAAVMRKETEQMRAQIQKRLQSEFETPRLRQLIGAEAQRYTANEAKAYIASQVESGLKPFRLLVENASQETHRLKDDQQEYEKKYRADYSRLLNGIEQSENITKTLTTKVQMIDLRDQLFVLEDRAIQDGDRGAFKSLRDIALDAKKSPELRNAALAGMARTKAFWVGVDKTKAVKVRWAGRDGKSKDEVTLNTCDLMFEAQHNTDWQVRVMAVRLLANHRKVGVPELILKLVHENSQLHVVKDAVIAFGKVTGFAAPDVFGSPHVENWWKQNAEVTTKRLTQLDCTR